ncbi:helix-turn-helix domain-containing protein [Albimonas pacifica]|uniref:Transcriptional regulator, contains XRE-family HTH domain n=1 Tax=Albimonas pacifica TaxID=1114924 RepID=A0A1I3C3R2_9RHOB|nr:helix-turn-helix domain-containing protein [Albimonas pacifica]SFH68829.1 Transcriptional regulator, contains XRE-family HTH domain [Albimonas pacifica]
MTASPQPSVGDHLRAWRRRRRMSQLACALEAEISQRHLSFVESGRARPSREMLLRLADCLEAPLRERNAILLAGGFAPVYPERPLDAPEMAAARAAVERILKGHEPFPALAVDRRWTILAANAGVAAMLALVEDASLLEGPVNALRVTLHPGGLAPRIANLAEWRAHVLERLRGQAALAPDPELDALVEELAAYPAPRPAPRPHPDPLGGVAVPLKLVMGGRELSFLSTTTVFGTAAEVTLSELALECFFPADEATAQALRGA